MAKIISGGLKVNVSMPIPGGGSINVSPTEQKNPMLEKLDIQQKQIAIQKGQKELTKEQSGILSKVDEVSILLKGATNELEKSKLLGWKAGIPKGRLGGFASKELGGLGMKQKDTDTRVIANDWSKQMQYMAAAGIAKQEGRGLSDADLRIAGAIAPNFDLENKSTILKKIELLNRMAKGKMKADEIFKIMEWDTNDLVMSDPDFPSVNIGQEFVAEDGMQYKKTGEKSIMRVK